MMPSRKIELATDASPIPVTFLAPPTLVEEIDRRAEQELIGRSAWLRRAAAAALKPAAGRTIRVGGSRGQLLKGYRHDYATR
jgi:hypothetical protein